MLKNWKKQIARDVIALGSIVFYALVIARALIGPFFPFLYQLLISATVLFCISFFFKVYDAYVSRGLVLAVLTSLFYKDIFFAVFAFLIYLGLIFSALHIRGNKEEIIKGIVAGIVSAVSGYYLAGLIQNEG